MSTLGTTETLSVIEAAEARRSIRKYTRDDVPVEDLREIVRVAGLAPSAWNVQPWHFVVVRDPEIKGRLQEAAYGQAQVGNAPAVIVLYSDMRDTLAKLEETVHPNYPVEQRPEVAAGVRNAFASKAEAEIEAWGASQSYIALGYLLLAAQSLGYATSPMLGFDAERVKETLDLPEHVTIPALVAVGVAAEEGFPHHRHSVDRIAEFV